MKRHLQGNIRSLLSAALLTASCATAHAQFIWLDEKGGKQYSDMPPPASVPANRVLKSPGGQPPVEVASPPPLTESAHADAVNKDKSKDGKDKGPMTTAEKNADYQKRKMERDEQEKKAAEQSKLSAEKAKNCARAREYKNTLDSGMRIATTDKNGERSFMSDQRREQETRDAARAASDCK